MSFRLKALPDGSGHYIYHKGDFNKKTKWDRAGIWDSVDGQNYTACPQCGKISRFTNDTGMRIFFDRRKLATHVEGCVVCPDCSTHFCIALEDYPLELTEDEKKAIRIVRRGLGKSLLGGWFHHYSGKFNVYVMNTMGVQMFVFKENRMSPFTIIRCDSRLPTETFKEWEPAVRKMIDLFNKKKDA